MTSLHLVFCMYSYFLVITTGLPAQTQPLPTSVGGKTWDKTIPKSPQRFSFLTRVNNTLGTISSPVTSSSSLSSSPSLGQFKTGITKTLMPQLLPSLTAATAAASSSTAAAAIVVATALGTFKEIAQQTITKKAITHQMLSTRPWRQLTPAATIQSIILDSSWTASAILPSSPASPASLYSPAAQTPTTAKCKPYIVGAVGNTFLGKFQFGLEPNCLPVMKMDAHDRCFLTNGVVTVRDAQMKGVTSYYKWGFPIVSFLCASGPSDSINGAFSPSLDAFRHVNAAMDMLQTWFHFPIHETSSFQIYVHVGQDWDNAGITTTPLSFQNFHSRNTSTLPMTIFIGDGKPKRTSIFPSSEKPRLGKRFSHPFTTPNVIGHEVGHALIWMTSSNIAVNTNAAAIVELFADMTGEILEYYMSGSVDWVTHTGLNIDPSRIRSFSRWIGPGKDRIPFNEPSSHDMYTRGNGFRHVFFLIAKRSGMRKAFIMFLYAARFYWSRHDLWSFDMAACGVLEAADNDVLAFDVQRYFTSVDVHIDSILCNTYCISDT